MVKVWSQTMGVRVEKVPGRARYSTVPMAGNQVLPGGGAKSKLSMRPPGHLTTTMWSLVLSKHRPPPPPQAAWLQPSSPASSVGVIRPGSGSTSTVS